MKYSIAILVALLGVGRAVAQSSSLYGDAQSRPPMTLQDASWTYQPPEAARTVKLHQLVTVLVDVKAIMMSNGKMDRKKQGFEDLKLPNWMKFFGASLGADPQSHGEPHARSEFENKLQSQADLQTRETLTFKISCHVVDIRPNGNLILEGTNKIKVNEEVWDFSLTGEIRPEAILPNNTVQSDQIAGLNIVRGNEGHVRDGYRRGWFLEWFDKWQPF